MGKLAKSSGDSQAQANDVYFSMGTLKSCVVAGVGFLADAYDLFVINIVNIVLSEVYTNPPQSDADKSMVSSTALWGAVAGQLFFGSLADYIGRRVIFITTILLISSGAILSAFCVDSSSFTIYQQLALYRFILGFGVGGEYPLSATYSSESTSPRLKGKLMATVFSMQGIGNLLACIVMYLLLISDCPRDYTWRIGLGFGAVPGLIAFYFRAKSHETAAFESVKKARVSHLANLRAALRVYWKPMMGTAGTWLLLDITFYGNGLFSGTITEMMNLGEGSTNAALNALYVALIALPGYFLAIVFMDPIGRHRLQWGGSAIIAALYFILGMCFDSLTSLPALFLILYGMTFLFSNFGPNTTTFIIPGEFYPPEVRATCHGISAACGKIGAAIAAYVFPELKTSIGLEMVLIICGAVGAAGAVWTILFVPVYSPENLGGEMQKKLAEYQLEMDKLQGDNRDSKPLLAGATTTASDV